MSESDGDGQMTAMVNSGPDEEAPFNPARYARNLPGRGGPAAYLDVKWRIEWFRSENPQGHLLSEIVELDDQHAVFKCTATKDALAGGGSASGYGSETRSDFNDFIEKAETKARGRALEGLGYGTTAMMADDALADSPVERPQSQERSTNAQRLSNGSTPQNAPMAHAAPAPHNAPPRPAQPRETASQPPPVNPPNAAAKPVVLSDTPYELSKGPSPAKIGELSDLMAARGESILTVPIRFTSKAVVSDAILRMKNGGASGLDRLWIRVMVKDANTERNKTFCDDVLMTFTGPEDQMNRFDTIVAEHHAADENLWWFLLWATKIVHDDPGLTMHRLSKLATVAPTTGFLDNIVSYVEEIGAVKNGPDFEVIFNAYDRFTAT